MSRHRLGFAVKVLGAGGLPSHDTRREAKAKDLALLRLREQLADGGIASEAGRLVVPAPATG